MRFLVLVLESIQYSNPAYWSASYREPPRSTIGIAAVQTAIEYEYRFTEYRFAEYEYDEIRCEDELGINPSAGRVEGLLGASISDRCHNQSSRHPGCDGDLGTPSPKFAQALKGRNMCPLIYAPPVPPFQGLGAKRNAR